MKVVLFQLDGKLPNLALMRLAAHHRAKGDEVELRRTGNPSRTFADGRPARVYASAIFTKTRPVVDRLLAEFPDATVGGTGWDIAKTLEHVGVGDGPIDYSDYPLWRQSIGFTQRGCRLKCGFCVVPKKEGAIRGNATVADIWRGEPFPRELMLLDNDFFGQPQWRERVAEIHDGGFKVDFNQGINARFLTDEAAEAIASLDYRACTRNRETGLHEMKSRRIYTAWDNRKDESRLFAGLDRLVRYGVKPHHIMVYVLIGYWPGETEEDWLYRQQKLRDFGCLPYPMPYERTKAAVDFQRWVIQAWDKGSKAVSWQEWKAASGEPRRLTRNRCVSLPLFGAA